MVPLEKFLSSLEGSPWKGCFKILMVLWISKLFFSSIGDISCSLKAYPRITIFEYMADSLDLRIVIHMEQLWRYFSPAEGHVPGIDYLKFWLFYSSSNCKLLSSFGDISH